MRNIYLITMLLLANILFAQDVKVLDLKSNDLIHLASTDKLYITTSLGVPRGNSLCVIDPYHGAIDTCYYIGDSPGVMASSHDEKYIYMGLQSRSEIVRFDVTRQTISLRIPLDQNGPVPGIIAEDIVVDPYNAERIAVALKNPTALPWQSGVVVYNNDIKLPNAISDTEGSNSLAFDTETGYLYGYRNETTTDLAIRKMAISNEGVSLVTTTDLQMRVNDRIKYANGKLYSNMGKVINISNDSIFAEGNYDVGLGFPVVEPDTENGSVLFLNAEFAAISFQTYDQQLFNMVEKHNYPTIKGNPFRLIRWGGNGKYAFVTKDFLSDFHSRLVILRECISELTDIPTVTLLGPACYGDTVTLNAVDQDGPVFWSNGQSGPEAQLFFSEVIFYSVPDDQGCLGPSSEPLLVSFTGYPMEPFIYLSPDALTITSYYDYGFGMTWYFNGNPIPDSDSPIWEVDEPGIYTFQVDWNGCLSGISNEINVMLSDVSDLAEVQVVRYFPNPTHDKVNLRFQKPLSSNAQVLIYSIDGKCLISHPVLQGQESFEISLESVPPGQYVIKAFSSGGQQISSGKVVKLQ